MMTFWSRLSRFTRILTIVVLMAAVGGSYARLRLKPLRADLAYARETEQELRSNVKAARARVQSLENEAHLAGRWTRFAEILQDQSTGRSLRDVLQTCGTDGGPEVSVEGADFTRDVEGRGAKRMAIELQVRGSYGELVRLLDELDRTFPPIEFRSAALRRPDGEDVSDDAPLVADLEAVIHEAR